MRIKLAAFWRKYRGELVITGAATAVSVLATIIAAALPAIGTRILIDVAIGFVIVGLLVGLLFNQKRLINSRFAQVSGLLQNYFGLPAVENQFFKRLGHFSDEKAILARVLVNRVLPATVDALCTDGILGNVHRINLILDSGTTITPVFPLLMRLGLPMPNDNVTLRIYTNNLAGIDEIHKVDRNAFCKLGERNFHLIGGLPLNKYRATTGDETQAFLETLWTEQRASDGCCVSIGVLTANWFVAGLGLDQLALCARGKGHFEFKKSIIENADYIILVAPLGKLLPIGGVKQLDKLIQDRDGAYSAYVIPDEKKARVHLLTSFRSPDSISPLVHISRQLRNLYEGDGCKNYTISDFNPSFDPWGNSEHVKLTDLPHEYVRVHAREIYG
jgi:hypothetical protein